MTVSAHDVAAAIRDRLPGIGTMKLHKLLYYCQGYHLAHTGEPLFAENIVAWDNGPVVATLWKAEDVEEAPPPPSALDNDGIGTVEYVMSRYGALSGADLGRLTHQEGPWLRADERRQQRGTRQESINRDVLRDWFLTADQGDEDDYIDVDAVRAWLSQVSAEPMPARGEPATRESLAAWASRAA